MSFVQELQKRGVHRVAVAYLAGAWLLIQILETLFPIFSLPETSIRLVVIALAIGFAPALIAAWVFEWTPKGPVRDTGNLAPSSIYSHRKFDRLVIAILALALVIFSVDSFILDPKRDAANLEAIVRDTARKARTEAILDSFGSKSIAILPFENMSSDPEQAYFADGIAEELLNQLTRVEGLRVISRTSAFRFKGSDATIVEIADTLDVAHVLEGSVRRAGDTIRITVQLIDAGTDTHLWSETYDRELQDVFAVQDEVAAKVVEQLKLTMNVSLSPVARHDFTAYSRYLQAIQIRAEGGEDWLTKAENLLEDALKIEPDFVAAQLELAEIYWSLAYNNYAESEEQQQIFYDRYLALVESARAIDPENAQLNVILGFHYGNDFMNAARYLERAILAEPTNKDALNAVMLLMTRLGRHAEAQAIGEYLARRNPIFYLAHRNLAEVYLESGQLELAEQSYQLATSLSPQNVTARWRFGLTYLFMGQPEKALAQFERIQTGHWYRLQGAALAYHDLRRGEDSEKALRELIANTADPETQANQWPYGMARLYGWLGNAEMAFRYLRELPTETPDLLTLDLDGPFFGKIRSDPRWMATMQRLGIAPEQLAEVEFEPRLPNEVVRAIQDTRARNHEKGPA